MPTDPQTETCPSCKTGTLVSIEERPDSLAKYFSCGHKHYDIHLEDTLEFHASLGYKAKSQGKGKPYVEGRTGDDLHRKTGKWMLLERVIDRAKNWYKELITDPETDAVVRHCEEPLADHRDHSSAKKKSEA
ncbi:zinc ribbon domain-containing protein [Candidatus Kaiserbacteria bacterium]|nr:zinc ribbon domain-containing protein [Candidatus Kaiserbacteria bacterium]